jgi:two-component system sensor histidine kinase RegB
MHGVFSDGQTSDLEQSSPSPGESPLGVTESQQRINLAWLLRLRWAALVGQSATMLAVVGLGVVLPVLPLFVSLLFLGLSNLAISKWAQSAAQITETHVSLLVACDILLISLQLYLTGGASNPFNFFFLVHIALAAVTLGPVRLSAIFGLACSCFFALFWWHLPLTMHSRLALPVPLHGEGMAVAFVLAAGLIVYFVHRVATTLRASELELARARDATARHQRLSSLGTLAAGAAHELATPLATIALVAKEIERHLQASVEAIAVPSLLDDTRLIRREVERCRTVLSHLASDAGTSTGEAVVVLSVESLVDQVVAELPLGSRVCVDWQQGVRPLLIQAASRSLTQAVRSVVKNAIQAANSAHPKVWLFLQQDLGGVVIKVHDNGLGMSPEVLTRVGEPFFTTKPPGEGMGLGLFLTRTVLHNTGGSLELRGGGPGGATTLLRLPIFCRDASAGVACPAPLGGSTP